MKIYSTYGVKIKYYNHIIGSEKSVILISELIEFYFKT